MCVCVCVVEKADLIFHATGTTEEETYNWMPEGDFGAHINIARIRARATRCLKLCHH
jgi:hypothetical protein